ncbi:HAD-IB family hydrolase [Phenylobacterium sp.]|uniref:HAD-IB family hydrolase n=1 Tax=Phenylobacterium sp. TaxID=1871053 RepID=UPI00286AD84F|nr:HAD-IB family hydrolase [Phenylobacterium sp.]
MAQDQPALSEQSSATPQEPPVVAFDFDGTLTTRDSFTAFLKWRAGTWRHAAGMLRLAPAAIAYLFHRDRGRLKAAAVREFLKDTPRERLEAEALEFAERFSRSLLRPDAVAAWMRWRAEPVRLVIVTASPELLVAPFARGLGADALIGTELAFDPQDRVAGGFATPNCRGAEKVVRLKALFGADVEIRAAYGDTSGDREMLAMAELRGYRVFKGTP